ncbi:MAG: signal peptidase II [Oscillospiraceae bacterium]|nr:signal peptidase II [Oscillospiraceae bacterium]
MIGILGMVAALVGLDQLFKYLTITHLQPLGSVPLIDGVFHLTYVENFGAAGGILQGKQLLLIVVTSIVLVILLAALLFKKIPGRFLPWMVGLVIAGGIGNLIDRIFRGFVVDYLDFCWIHYPVFNFADCCVVVGVLAIAVYVFWSDRKREKTAPEPPKGEGR